MDSIASEIAEEVKAAFPAVRTSKFVPMVNSSQGSEPYEVAADFENKCDWTKLDASWLDQSPNGLASALSFLSDEAACFYIPAYMTADLAGALQHVDPTFDLTHGFDQFSMDRRIWPRSPETWTEYGERRWYRLTNPQVLAVIHYLEWRIAKEGLSIEHGIGEALSGYWYGRANRL